jgi:hypothetical protein
MHVARIDRRYERIIGRTSAIKLSPIAAVRIGCVVEDGGAMHGTVLDRSAKITALTPLEQIECSMSGESDLDEPGLR